MNEETTTEVTKLEIANAALKEGLDVSYYRHREPVDHKHFEVKLDPVTEVVNLKSDLREIHAVVARLEAELLQPKCRAALADKPVPVPVRLGWRMKLKRWWRWLRAGGAS